jgi:hypothetical protein
MTDVSGSRISPTFEGELGELELLWSGFLFYGRVAFGLGRGVAVSRGIAVKTEGFLGGSISFFRLFCNVTAASLESRFSLLANFGKRATGEKAGYGGDEEYGQ